MNLLLRKPLLENENLRGKKNGQHTTNRNMPYRFQNLYQMLGDLEKTSIRAGSVEVTKGASYAKILPQLVP